MGIALACSPVICKSGGERRLHMLVRAAGPASSASTAVSGGGPALIRAAAGADEVLMTSGAVAMSATAVPACKAIALGCCTAPTVGGASAFDACTIGTRPVAESRPGAGTALTRSRSDRTAMVGGSAGGKGLRSATVATTGGVRLQICLCGGTSSAAAKTSGRLASASRTASPFRPRAAAVIAIGLAALGNCLNPAWR